jgi:DNA-binding XRE family transcriptional regulator
MEADMPIAIAIGPGGIIPAILQQDRADNLLAQLRGMVFAPTLADVDAARVWLTSQPEPSGWYETAAEVQAVLARMQRESDMTPEQIAEARTRLGMSRADLALAIGIGGNSNTRHKRIFDIEAGKGLLNPSATRALRALLVAQEMQGDTPSQK